MVDNVFSPGKHRRGMVVLVWWIRVGNDPNSRRYSTDVGCTMDPEWIIVDHVVVMAINCIYVSYYYYCCVIDPWWVVMSINWPTEFAWYTALQSILDHNISQPWFWWPDNHGVPVRIPLAQRQGHRFSLTAFCSKTQFLAMSCTLLLHWMISDISTSMSEMSKSIWRSFATNYDNRCMQGFHVQSCYRYTFGENFATKNRAGVRSRYFLAKPLPLFVINQHWIYYATSILTLPIGMFHNYWWLITVNH